MSTPWTRLDNDFYRDPKVEELESLHKSEGIYRWLKLVCMASNDYGQLDLSKRSVRGRVEINLGLSGKKLDGFIADCVECRLFDAEKWGKRIITSRRLLLEGNKRRKSEQDQLNASKAGVDARKDKGGKGGKK